MRRSTNVALVLVCLILLAASPVRAAQDVFSWIPNDAVGLVAVNDLDAIHAKWKSHIVSSGVTQPSPLVILRLYFGTVKGLDQKATTLLIAMPGKSRRPMLLVPTTDYETFLGQLKPEKVTDTISSFQAGGAQSFIAKRDNYAIIVGSSDRELLDTMLEGKYKPMDLGDWRPWLAKSDVSGVITQAGLAQTLLRWPGILKIKPEAENALGLINLTLFDWIEKQAKKEITTVAIGLSFGDNGSLRATVRARCIEGSKLCKKFSRIKPLSADALAGLPKSDYLYALAARLPKRPQDVGKFDPDDPTLGPSEWQAIFKQVYKIWENIEGVSSEYAVQEKGRSMDELTTKVYWTTDADKFVDDYAALITMVAKQTKNAEDSSPEIITVEPTELDGRKTLKITTDKSAMFNSVIKGMDEEQRDQMEKASRELVKQLFGPDGKEVVHVVAADKARVVFSYGDADRAKKAVAAITDPQKESLAVNKLLATTAAQLPADAQWIGFVDPTGILRSQVAMNWAPDAKADQSPAPPIGVALTASPTGFEAQLYAPAPTVKAVGKLWKTFAPVFFFNPMNKTELEIPSTPHK